MGETKNDGGGGSKIRLAILVIILVLVAVGFYYDRFVLQPQATDNIKTAMELMNQESDDGHGVPKSKVKETIGFEPQESFPKDNFEVEVYRYGRVLPVMQGQYLTVVYENGSLTEMIPNGEFDPNNRNVSDGIYVPPEEGRQLPAASLGGGGGGGQRGGGGGDGDSGERERPAADDDGNADDADKGDDGKGDADKAKADDADADKGGEEKKDDEKKEDDGGDQ